MPISPPLDSQPYWDAITTGKIAVQRCLACGYLQLYFRLHCTRCAGLELEPHEVNGVGRVTTWTSVHRQVPNSHGWPTPYDIGLVRLEDGPAVSAILAPDVERRPRAKVVCRVLDNSLPDSYPTLVARSPA